MDLSVNKNGGIIEFKANSKEINFNLKTKSFYNSKGKEVKFSTAKTFFKDIKLNDVSHETNLIKATLIVRFFELASSSTKNIVTAIEKYCEVDFLETWLYDKTLFLLILGLKHYDSELSNNKSRITYNLQVPYNKVYKESKIFINEIVNKGMRNYSHDDFYKIIDDICLLSKNGYTSSTIHMAMRDSVISVEDGNKIMAYINSLIRETENNGLHVPSMLFSLIDIQCIKFNDDRGKQQKYINSYILFCKKIIKESELHGGRKKEILSIIKRREIFQYADTLINVYNHDIDRTFDYLFELYKDGNLFYSTFMSNIRNYIDYLLLRTEIYKNTQKEKELTQSEINTLLKSGRYLKHNTISEQHDLAVKVLNNLKIEYNDIKFKTMTNRLLDDDTIEGWVFRTPLKPKELAIEGAVLGNCVKSYIEKVIRGETQIVLLRPSTDVETPNVVFEVRDNAIVQLEGKSRRRANMYESKAIREYIKNKNLKCTVPLEVWKTPKKPVDKKD